MAENASQAMWKKEGLPLSLNEHLSLRTILVAVAITSIAGVTLALLTMEGFLPLGALMIGAFCVGWFNFVYCAAKFDRNQTSRRGVIVLIAAGVFFAGSVRGLTIVRSGDMYALIPTLFSLLIGLGFLWAAWRLRRLGG